MPVLAHQKLRFGPFELDPSSGELFKLGYKLNLRGQPVDVLSILLERPGEVVTREELCKRLWPRDTFVDFEHSLNTAIKKLRQALDDDVETPRYIETLPKRGYRFVAAVEQVTSSADAAARENTSARPSGVPGVTGVRPGLERSAGAKRRLWRLVISALLVLATAAGIAYRLLRPRVPVVTAVRQLTHTGKQKAVLVPGGTRLYFLELNAGQYRVGEVSTEGGEVSYPDTGFESPDLMDVSPDGSELLLGVGRAPRSAWILPMPAGTPRFVRDGIVFSTFLPGSSQIVYWPSSDFLHLFACNVDGSNVHPLLQLPRDPETQHWAISPDGRLIRYGTADGQLWESSINGSQKRLLTAQFRETRDSNWRAGNKLFLFTSPKEGAFNIWAISESGWLRDRKVKPVQLTFGPVSYSVVNGTRDGKRIYAIGREQQGELSVYDAHAGTFRKYLNGVSGGSTDFSHDGQWVAYVTHPEGRLWRSRLDGSERRQLTFAPMGPVIVPRWSPDGRFIAFMEWGGQRRIYLVSPDGGAPMLLLSGDLQPADPDWSPDGKFLMYGGAGYGNGQGNPESKRTEIRVLDLSTRRSETIPGSVGMFSPRWSPDGRYVAAMSDNLKKLMLYSFDTQRWEQLPVPKLQEDALLADPLWSHDSRTLYFMHGVNIYRMRVPGGQPELVVSGEGVKFAYPALGWAAWFGLTPDDQILLMLDRGVEELYALELEYR